MKIETKKQKIVSYFILSILFIVCVELVTLLVLSIWKIPQVNTIINQATASQSEPFTELYFEDHLTLPSKVIPKKIYTFKFTIRNLEEQDIVYPYDVYALTGDTKLMIDNGNTTIKKGESNTIQEIFTTENTFPKTKIVVELKNKKQQISFWIGGKVK
jgi:hypothetical protein